MAAALVDLVRQHGLTTTTVVGGVIFLLTVALALWARRRPVVTGREDLLHCLGEAMADFADHGLVRVNGELWQATSTAALHEGDRVRVTGSAGLTLEVEP